MKVNCDFLPQKYKAYIINYKLLFVDLVLLVLLILAGVGTGMSFSSRIAREEKILKAKNAELSRQRNILNSISYDQERIRRLIVQFRFIQQAMGQSDFPYLDFYLALEHAIPVSDETGRKRVAITSLTPVRGLRRWKLSGVAYHWDDVLKFEANLNASKSLRKDSPEGPKKKDFSSINVQKIEYEGDKVNFEMEFEYMP